MKRATSGSWGGEMTSSMPLGRWGWPWSGSWHWHFPAWHSSMAWWWALNLSLNSHMHALLPGTSGHLITCVQKNQSRWASRGSRKGRRYYTIKGGIGLGSKTLCWSPCVV
jgi:hypothetical protein